nr:hypothetical protein HK105_005811 [Polyrhizophydium stewartii]
MPRPSSAAINNIKAKAAAKGKTTQDYTRTHSAIVQSHMAATRQIVAAQGLRTADALLLTFSDLPDIGDLGSSLNSSMTKASRPGTGRGRRGSLMPSQAATPAAAQAQPAVSLASPDMKRIGVHVARLTDIDSLPERIAESVATLIRMCHENTAPPVPVVLFEEGCLSALMALLPRVMGFPDVIAGSLQLVNLMINANPGATSNVIKMGGLQLLTKSAEVVSKSYLEAKARLDRRAAAAEAHRQSALDQSIGANGPRRSLGGTRRLSTSLSQSHGNFVDELGAAPAVRVSSYAEVSSLGLSGTSAHLAAQEEELEPVRIVPIENEPISEGLLRRFYEPKFIDTLDKMDKPTKATVVKDMLTLFEKVDNLLAVSSCIALDLSLDSALEKILEDIDRMIHCEIVLLYLVDQQTGELVAYEVGMSDSAAREREIMGAVRFPPGHGIAGHAAALGELINIRDPLTFPKYHDEIDYRGGRGQAYSIICTPICTMDGTVLGIIELVNKIGPNDEKQSFTHPDEYLLKTISMTAGTIMVNAKMYETMLNTQKKVEVLLETTRSLSSILEIDVLINRIMESAKQLLSADRCTLFLHDSEREQLRAPIQGRDSFQEIRIPRNAGIAGAVFMSGEPINIPDAYSDSRFNPAVDRQTGYRTRNILCMPIKNIHGECIGVTQMINKKSGAFTSEDEMILSSFSAQAAVAIEKSQLFKKTEDMRIYLQSILSSITSCVLTLTESMKLHTLNRPWLMNALGKTEQFMRENSCDRWFPPENQHIVNDIKRVFEDGQSIYSSDYEIKGESGTLIVNYQIMPLIGSKGVVMVLDDISSEKRAVMTLGRYMSPALAKQVMEDDGQLGGKRKKVSILFSDIRSFTTLSEGMEPTDVVEMLNQHFTDAVNAITDEQGILDKFIGDAVMAVFGVPFASPEDAVHACNAALRMRESLAVFNRIRAAAGKQTIKIGIGVNTGMVLSGNIGSSKRMEFSCIGDAVNLASRTEGLTKFYGIMILVTEFTLMETGDAFITREVESVVVTGKKSSVRMYELLGRKGDELSHEASKAVELYASGYELYKQRNFKDAADLFRTAIEICGDGPSKVLLSRCEHYIEAPPPPDWTGVYVAEGK